MNVRGFVKRICASKLVEFGCLLLFAAVLVTSYLAILNSDSFTVSKTAASDSVDDRAMPEVELMDTSDEVPYIIDTRTVKEYRGSIGIYDCFGTLVGTYDADLHFLPTEDRKRLEEGITFDSEPEMTEFLESFDS